jgi:CIC family chloride channel protein
VLDLAASSSHSTFPVLDGEGKLVGVISLEEIRRVMNENLPEQIIAHDIMVTEFPRLTTDTDLAEALRTLSAVDLDELPVLDAERGNFVGLLSRKQLTKIYVERMSAMRRSAS